MHRISRYTQNASGAVDGEVVGVGERVVEMVERRRRVLSGRKKEVRWWESEIVVGRLGTGLAIGRRL